MGLLGSFARGGGEAGERRALEADVPNIRLFNALTLFKVLIWDIVSNTDQKLRETILQKSKRGPRAPAAGPAADPT